MSVIQQIQEKYAKLMAVIIAIALIIFVIMLAFENGGNLFASLNSDDVGEVNGKEITRTQFEAMVDEQEGYMKSQGYPASSGLRSQASEMAWDREVSRLLLASQVDELGMEIGNKELGEVLYGPNSNHEFKQQFTDPKTGQFNAQLFKQQLNAMEDKGTPEQKAMIATFIDRQKIIRLSEKYSSLLTNTVNVPRWLVEKQNKDNSLLAKVSFVREVYSSVPDSSVKVTDAEIDAYVKKHKDDFKQEETRSIAYVSFSALPTAIDSAEAVRQLVEAKAEFDSTSDAAGVINRVGSSIEYSDAYYSRKDLTSANQQMGMPFKDTILSLSKNAVYGPYLDGGSYVLAKMLDSKSLPDSVKCRHVLISTNVQEGGFDDTTAKRKIDSVAAAIQGGADWGQMVLQYNPASDGSRADKGEMTFSAAQIQAPNFAPEFGEFILFSGKPKERKVVKTSFGYHYIEILEQKNVQPFYKIAYLGRNIEAGQETLNNASNEANQFAANSRDLKSFDDNAAKLQARGINKLVAADIAPASSMIQGVGVSRNFVREIYDADLGDVIQPEKIGDAYVVAIVTEANKKGTQSAAKARRNVEPLLRNQKKAELLTKKVGNVTTLEAAATALGGKQIETVDSVRMAQNARPALLSFEPKVIGAAFNMANKGKVVPQVIAGNSGVYVVRVDDIVATPILEGTVEDQRKTQEQQAKMRGYNFFQPLKDAASIKDNRAKLY